MGSFQIILTLLFVSVYMFSGVSCTEFLVGGEDGWIVPKSKSDGDMYNKWASKNRFKVNDSVRFKYEKDSVMVVTEEEYKKCRSSRPEFFSNNGDTIFELDRSGLFYFVSGVAGHCEKGQRMIIKVLDTEAPPQSPSPPAAASEKNLAGKMGKITWFGYGGLAFATALVVSVFGSV